MASTSSSCQYIPSDIQQKGLSLIYGEHVSCVFDGKESVVAVDRASFSIEEGKITAIIGSSGSGKSTLLKLIYGLLEPDNGEIRYRGWLVPTRKDKLIPGHDAMKMVSQGFDDLNLYAKVWDNVASQLPNTDLDYKQVKTQEILEKLQITHLSQKRVADLSGGEKQRVAISRALVNDPEVLLMDEPFNQVDAAFRDTLQQDIQGIVSETGLTIVLVSHDPAEVLALSHQLIVMKEGRIVDSGIPEQLYHNPKSPYTARLLAKSNIVQPEEATQLGITTTSSIAIHQENIQLDLFQDGDFIIQDILFRGLFYEVIVQNEKTFILHAVLPSLNNLKKGDHVQLKVLNYTSF